jgi:hypothetical protein
MDNLKNKAEGMMGTQQGGQQGGMSGNVRFILPSIISPS